jgi:hypothetical protein
MIGGRMKKVLMIFTLAFVFLGVKINAQDEIISGDITTNTTLTANKTYLLKGFVRVQSGATLTVEAGTTIYGKTQRKDR